MYLLGDGIRHVDYTSALIIVQDGGEGHLVPVQEVLLLLRVEVTSKQCFVAHQGLGKLLQCRTIRLKRTVDEYDEIEIFCLLPTSWFRCYIVMLPRHYIF